MTIPTIQNCPSCGKLLETVRHKDGGLLGYFCPHILTKCCDYIDCKPSREYEAEKSAKEEG